MNKRPVSVTVISVLFLAAGLVGLVYHATELKNGFRSDAILVCLVRLIAVIGAVYAFRGKNWARWVLIVWMAYHVVLSAFHSLSELVMHSLLLVIIGYFLFSSKATSYFRGGRTKAVAT